MDGKRTGESEQAYIHRLTNEIERLRQQNAELVEALRRIANDQDGLDVWSFAEEAIAKATGGE